MSTRILLVEDDADIRDLVAIYLRREGCRVDPAKSAEQGLDMLGRSAYDLLITDIMLPGMDGMKLVKAVRERSDMPILFMTSRIAPQDIVAGLDVGGDDYITKPFEPEVLVARVKAALRRSRVRRSDDGGEAVWDDGWLNVRKEGLEVFVGGAPATLPAKELQLLLYLLEHPKKVFSVAQLYEKIWGLDGISDERTVMVHIHHLRKKIEKDPANPAYIVTVRGFGYKFGGER